MAARRELSGLNALGTLQKDGFDVWHSNNFNPSGKLDVAGFTASAVMSLLNAAGNQSFTGGLGVGGGTPDATNRLVVNGAAVLFNNAGAGVQAKLNKNATADTASFLFQTAFSGRAEFGTLGNDSFTLKTSANGSTWADAFAVAGTGVLDFKQRPTYLGNAIPDLSSTHTVTGPWTFSGTFTVSAALADIGTSTAASTINVGAGATANAVTKTLNLGTAGVSGSTTVVNIGSAVGGAIGSMVVNLPTVTFSSSVTAIGAANANLSTKWLGVGGATADATNRFSINTSNLLFNNAGGSIDATFNKAAAGNDASFSFKTNFTAYAILGLLADNNFTIKVGTGFTTAMVIDNTNGKVSFPAGIKQLSVGTTAPVSPAVGDLWVDTN